MARFEAERQALALMDHSSIAKVLDAGATDTGRPYFVMELVDGIKITDYCEQNRLMTRQRLDLFIQVCGAIQHAHQKGILVTFSQFNGNAGPWSLLGCELEIRGTLGTLYLFGDGYEIVPDNISEDEFPARSPVTRSQDSQYRKKAAPRIEARKARGSSTSDTSLHARNFLDCVKSRAKCNCDIEIGHRSTSATLLANIALKTRAVLDWDSRSERFPDHPQANKLLSYQYRAPYKLP